MSNTGSPSPEAMRRDALRPISYLLRVLGAKPKLLILNFGDAHPCQRPPRFAKGLLYNDRPVRTPKPGRMHFGGLATIRPSGSFPAVWRLIAMGESNHRSAAMWCILPQLSKWRTTHCALMRPASTARLGGIQCDSECLHASQITTDFECDPGEIGSG